MNKQQIKLFSSKKTDHWQTPEHIYNFLEETFSVSKKEWFDPCPRYPKQDGLNIEWGKNCFVNPPYSNVGNWLEKAHKEIKKGNTELVVFLVFANTDTKWFHNHVVGSYNYLTTNILFIKGRLKFIGDEGIKNSAMRPSILIEMRKK